MTSVLVPRRVCLAVFLGAAAAAPAGASTINVNTLADEFAGNSSCSLREAVVSINAGFGQLGCVYAPDGDATPDVILLQSGTYVTSQILSFSQSAELRGRGSSSTFIHGTSGLVMSVELSGPTLILRGVTMRNTAGNGIAYIGPGARLEVKYSVLRDSGNDGWDGGAIHTFGSALLEYSTIRDNRGRLGGGVYVAGIDPSCRVELSHSTVSGNSAALGGGIYSFCPVQVDNSTISGNRATAWWGGAILSRQNEGTDNTGYLSLNLTTVAFNTAAKQGGGVFVYPWEHVETDARGSIVARNTIVAYEPTGWLGSESPAPDYFGCPYFRDDEGFGWNLFGTPNVPNSDFCDVPLRASDQVGVDPRLGSLASNGGPTQTHALNSGSPAIDRSNEFFVETDQRGPAFPRPIGGAPDIGAFERSPNTVTVRETEGLTVAAKSSDSHAVVWSGDVPGDDFSSGRGTNLQSNAVGDFVTYTVNIPAAATYSVRVGVKRQSNYGQFQLATATTVGGTYTSRGSVKDLYRAAPEYLELTIGNVAFGSSGNRFFRFRVTGRNAGSSGFQMGFDYIKLVRQ